MKIGFDAKRAAQNFTGLGNYSRFVISNLLRYYPNNVYQLFSPKPVTNNEILEKTNVQTIVKKRFRPFWRTLWIANDIKRAGVDIYHGLSNELPYGINKTGVKSVVTIHDLIFLRYPQFYSFIDRKIYDLKARYACKVADRIIAVSECTKRDIIHYYGTDPSKIDVIYQGCFSIFSEKASEEKKKEVIAKYKLPSKFLLSIGSIEDRKNILLIAKALKHVPDIHFVAVGKQRKYAQKIKEFAATNGLSDRICLRSNISLEDFPAILQSCEIFIYPSLYEGFGIPIVEALSSGVPVIAATGSCLEEAGGNYSVYVAPDNEKELAIQINNLLNDPTRREKMIEEGLKYVKRFSGENCSKEIMKVYEKLL